MNLRKSIYLIGSFVTYFGLFLLAPLLGLLFMEKENLTNTELLIQACPFVLSSLLTLTLGYGIKKFFYDIDAQKKELTRKDGFFLASLIWIMAGLLGSLPYVLSSINIFFSAEVFFQPVFIDNVFINSFFESVSGITTTGATVFNSFPDIEKHQLLIFWRSLSQWLGGIGIILLVLIIFPRISVGVMQIATDQEGTGPQKDRITPRLYETGLTLFYIYLGLTISLSLLLFAVGNLTVYDSIVHTLSTVSSGGFSSYPLNIQSFSSPIVEAIIIIFMFLSGISFAIFYFLITGNYKKILENSEFKTYVSLNLLVIIFVVFTLDKFYNYESFIESIRFGVFQSISLTTGTGFTSFNFDLWTKHTKFILLIVMIIGGCSGSTTGGIKIIRLLIILKRILIEIKRRVSPNIISTVKINGKSIDDEIVSGVSSFLFLYLGICLFAPVLIIIFEQDITALSAFSSVISSIANVGPGFGLINPHAAYSFFTVKSKLLLSFLMLFGRLEIFTLFALLIPSFWKKY
ncbi:MAG: TrkH family potassium uptake protein [Thermodesulfobacteriota bacterium]|nr:MAG: TrkH family potassium uptake protein [Candidatus Dadabacteria bacterium]